MHAEAANKPCISTGHCASHSDPSSQTYQYIAGRYNSVLKATATRMCPFHAVNKAQRSRVCVNLRLRAKMCMYSVQVSTGLTHYAEHDTSCQNMSMRIAQKFKSQLLLPYTACKCVFIRISALLQRHAYSERDSCMSQKQCSSLDTACCIKLQQSIQPTYCILKTSLDDPVVSMQYMQGIIPEHNRCWVV